MPRRSMIMLKLDRPHNDLPPLPPRADIETKEVLKRCIGARTALERLRTAGHLIPNQAVLASIPLLEARGSSEIENIVTTNDALFREASLGGEGSDPATKEAHRYRTALFDGYMALRNRPVSTRLAVDICRKITAIDLDVRSTPGTSLRNVATGEVVYTPPEGPDRLRDLLANWEKYINEPSDLDPVVKMAVQHYQFEAIHPFIDGNGRTGRILNILCLVQDGLLDLPTLYLSRHILKNRAQYYKLLGEVTTEGNWVAWILYMLEAVETTALWTDQKIRAIRQMMDAATELVRGNAPNIYSRELIELIFSHPYCRIGDVVKGGIAKRQVASNQLKGLAQLGVLQEYKHGRDKLFFHWNYVDLLDSESNVINAYPTGPI